MNFVNIEGSPLSIVSYLTYLRQECWTCFSEDVYFNVLFNVGHDYEWSFLMSMDPLDYRKATSSVLLVYDDPLLSHCSMIFDSRVLSCCCNGFYYSYFTHTYEYNLTSSRSPTISPYYDGSDQVYRRLKYNGLHVYGGTTHCTLLYCYSRLELGLEHRCKCYNDLLYQKRPSCIPPDVGILTISTWIQRCWMYVA